ncbi:hypothetical protein NIES3974_28950 [Calothrix sp. NIES-3974]|nr:hypothetical protein NIES3974_28950 [Calothrix sp. NIES-3974]
MFQMQLIYFRQASNIIHVRLPRSLTLIVVPLFTTDQISNAIAQQKVALF